MPRQRAEGRGPSEGGKALSRSRRKQSLEQRRFEVMVQQAVNGLPPTFRELLGDVPVIVEDEPSAEDLATTGTPEGETLFGMYHGVPLTERVSGFGLTLPERITVYRLPIEAECPTRQDIIWEVQSTLVHELAHHYGISEERLTELGWE